MYPDNIFQWMAYVGIVIGTVAILVLIVLAIHEMREKRRPLEKMNPDDEIPDKIDDLPE